MNISVTSTIIEFDKKAASYGKCDSGVTTKPMSKWSYFSDPSELNALPKNISGVPKIGDQRSIVDFLGCYNEDEDAEFLGGIKFVDNLRKPIIEENVEEVTRNKKTIINKIIKKFKRSRKK